MSTPASPRTTRQTPPVGAQPAARGPLALEVLEPRRLLSAAVPALPIGGGGGTGTGTSPRYTVTDLGTLGGSVARALAINDAGDVVGVATDAAGRQHAFLWTKLRGLQDLGALDNLRQSSATAINAGGVIAGTLIKANNVFRAIMLDNTGATPTDLGALNGLQSESEGINDADVVVGSSTRSDGSTHATIFNALKSPRGAAAVQDLGTLGGTNSVARDVNNAGQVVGESDTASGEHHAFIYSPDAAGTVRTPRLTDLGTLNGLSSAKAVSDTGLVVGFAFTGAGQEHAVLFQGGKVTDLGTLGGSTSLANGVNSIGQIVGTSTTGTGAVDHGFIYQNGQMSDLNTSGVSKNLLINTADAINDAGQIVGSASDGTVQHAVLLTPVGAAGGTGDVTRPVARLTSAPTLKTAGAASYFFDVTYSDNARINVTTLDNTDVRVTSKLGFSRLASFDHANRHTNGSPLVATYRLRAPGGAWDRGDNGVYTVQVEANQVSDTGGNFVRTAALGTFTVAIPRSGGTPAPTALGVAATTPFAAAVWSAQAKRELFGDELAS